MQMLYNNLYSISEHGNEIGCSTLFILYRSNINRYHKKGGREPRKDTWCRRHIGDRTDYKQRTFRGLFGEATQIIMHFLWNQRLMALSCFNTILSALEGPNQNGRRSGRKVMRYECNGMLCAEHNHATCMQSMSPTSSLMIACCTDMANVLPWTRHTFHRHASRLTSTTL